MSDVRLRGTLVLVTIRVVLADDHVVLRQGVRALLRDESDIELVGEADNGQDAVDVVLETVPDVALINLVIPEIDGVAATRIIHRESLKTRILILLSSQEVDKTAVIAAVRAGAIGVIRKSANIELVVRSIRGAARGEAQFSPADASLLVEEVQAPERLTARELEVLQMICDGLANKEIAWKLRISEKTVKKHVSMILDKFGVQSRTQAALHAWRVGLARPERLQVGAAPIASMDRARRLHGAPHVASPA